MICHTINCGGVQQWHPDDQTSEQEGEHVMAARLEHVQADRHVVYRVHRPNRGHGCDRRCSQYSRPSPKTMISST